MKRLLSLLLAAVLSIGLVSTAFAGTKMMPSVENKEKKIIRISGHVITERDTKNEEYGTKGRIPTEDIAGREDIIIVTPIAALKSSESEATYEYLAYLINNAARDGNGTGEVEAVLENAYNEFAENTLYQVTKNTNFNRTDLRICDLFEVTYATREEDSGEEFARDDYPLARYGKATIVFENVTNELVAVLHGNDEGTKWELMNFTQTWNNDHTSSTVTVTGFTHFSPVAFICQDVDDPDYREKGPITKPITPHKKSGDDDSGGTTDVPKSPQTGQVQTVWPLCLGGVAYISGGLFIRRKRVR